MTLASIANFLHRKVVLPAAASLAILAGAQTAKADFVDTRTNKPAETATATPTTDSNSQIRISFAALDTPKQKGTIASGSLFAGNEQRFRLMATSEQMTYDSTTGLDLLRDTTRIQTGIDLKFTPEFWASLQIGTEKTDYTGPIDLKADRDYLSIKFAQVQESRGLLLGLEKGTGQTDYTLASGFTGSGNLDTLLLRLRATHTLGGRSRKPEFEGEETTDEKLPMLIGDIYHSNATFGSLMNTSTIGARGSYVFAVNDKITLAPFVEFTQTTTDGKVSVRDSDVRTWRAVGKLSYEGQNYTLFAQAGYMSSRTEITDEVNGNDNGKKSGMEYAIGGTLKF